MFDSEITQLLQKSLANLPIMICNRTLKSDLDELVKMAVSGASYAIVDDKNTAEILGNKLAQAAGGKHVTLEGTPAADDKTLAFLRAQVASSDVLIAVGGGTISDLCKYVSFLDHKPYIVFPTAASMNGYCSANASITFEGYKKTVAAHMPKAVFCDLSVIASAPSILSKSGLGDSLARPTAQADWLLSHLLLGTDYNEVPFTLLASLEPQLFEQARGIATGDMASIEPLIQTLLLSGLGMTIAGGSYPASQGEHMIAHTMEMLVPNPIRKNFHGQEIGVTTLFMARLQEKLLRKKPSLRNAQFPETDINQLFGAQIASEAKKSYRKKQGNMERASFKHWDDIAHRLEKIMLPSEKILAILKAADAPTAPEMLGWSMADFETASAHARFLRDRFTFLDLE